MSEKLDTQVLPLLPLTSGVALPGMVVTLTLETPEAKLAVAAAREKGDALVLVPRLEQRYARIGAVAKVEDVGRLQNGMDAMVVRGLGRALVGTSVAGTGDATWVQVTDAEDLNQDTPKAQELAREYRGTVENIAEQIGVPQIAQMVRGIRDNGALADVAGYSPELTLEQKVEILDTSTSRPGSTSVSASSSASLVRTATLTPLG